MFIPGDAPVFTPDLRGLPWFPDPPTSVSP